MNGRAYEKRKRNGGTIGYNETRITGTNSKGSNSTNSAGSGNGAQPDQFHHGGDSLGRGKPRPFFAPTLLVPGIASRDEPPGSWNSG